MGWKSGIKKKVRMLFAQQDPHFGSYAANILGDNSVYDCAYNVSIKIQSFYISEKNRNFAGANGL